MDGLRISAFKRYAVDMHNGFSVPKMYLTGYGHVSDFSAPECSVCGKRTREYLSFTADDDEQPIEVVVGMGCLKGVKEVA